jgi:hypothetical protein
LVTALVVLPTASSASVVLRTPSAGRHFGDAAGIVGDRAEGVERHDHAGQRQHGGGRDGDAEQAGQLVGDDDAGEITSAGSAVDSIEIARPWMTLVPWPVTEALAIDFTGRKLRCRCSIR